MAIDYKKSGVDIEAGEALVDWLKSNSPDYGPLANNIEAGIGGFSALFRLDMAGMKEPCLVSATDGVGTKLKLAIEFQRFEGIGQDLLAMCVNDLVTCGAKPLFFLDYYATGKLELAQAKSFLGGLQKACAKIQVPLIGGETAEMPGMYQKGDFDCAGFAVGIVDKEKALGPSLVKEGDSVIGFASSGFHSNGYSLLRQVFSEDSSKWADVLLEPTSLYVELADKLSEAGGVHAMAHITGGGIDNIGRVLPDGHCLRLEHWEWPEPFQVVQERSGMTTLEMLKTLNCGIGLVAIVKNASECHKVGADLGIRTYELGKIEKSLENEKILY